jgi:glycosyltransferase involved in cell wall biosynthesis
LNAALALYCENLGGGGVQTVFLRLATGLAERGRRVELWVGAARGALVERVPAAIPVVEIPPASRLAVARAVAAAGRTAVRVALLGRERDDAFARVPGLIEAIRARAPGALLAATPYRNLEALIAADTVERRPHVFVSEHNDLRAAHAFSRPPHAALLARLQPPLYARAAGVVAVSNGVADDVARRSGLARDRITVIANPAVVPELDALAAEPVDHPWLAPGAPSVVLAVGRLGAGKDRPTLLRAFARLRAKVDARLVLVGGDRTPAKTAKRKAALVALATELGVADSFDLPGYAANPFAFMARAAVLAVTSRNEGFCNVIAEALACGCPVVSTDCPSGPAELLDGGRYGRLVPVGDDAALAAALEATLAAPRDADRLRARGRRYDVATAVGAYERLCLMPAEG